MRWSITLAAALLSACGLALQHTAPFSGEPACRAPAPAGPQVLWLLPETDRAALDAWCAGVGPALVHTAAPVATVAAAAAEGGAGAFVGPFVAPQQLTAYTAVDSVLVVAWNVQVGGGDLRRFVRDLRSGTLTGGTPVTDFVLLVQEAWRGGDAVPALQPGSIAAPRLAAQPPAGSRLPIDALAHQLGLHLLYVPSMRNGAAAGAAAEDRGNAILSTLPLAQPLALELPVERQRRVAVAATVAATTASGSAWTLQLVSVHLENRVGIEVDGVLGVPGVAARARQTAWLLRRLPAAELAVLGGDLNTWVAETAEPAAAKSLARYPDTPPPPAGPTHTSLGIFRARLDYLFARVPGGSVRRYQRVDDAYGSDHFPLLAWVLLPQG